MYMAKWRRTEYLGSEFPPYVFPSHSLVDPPAQRYLSIKQPWLQHRANSLPPNNPKMGPKLTLSESKLKVLFTDLKKLMAHLDNEKVMLFDKMTQLNQSDKIASQYIKQYSESFFIDKDF